MEWNNEYICKKQSSGSVYSKKVGWNFIDTVKQLKTHVTAFSGTVRQSTQIGNVMSESECFAEDRNYYFFLS